MSWTTKVTLWCDGNDCAEQITIGNRDLVETRRQARAQGWAVLYGTMDVCPFHNQNGPTAKQPPQGAVMDGAGNVVD